MFVAKAVLLVCLLTIFDKDSSWQVCEPLPAKSALSREPLFCICKKRKQLCSQETELKDLCPKAVGHLNSTF